MCITRLIQFTRCTSVLPEAGGAVVGWRLVRLKSFERVGHDAVCGIRPRVGTQCNIMESRVAFLGI